MDISKTLEKCARHIDYPSPDPTILAIIVKRILRISLTRQLRECATRSPLDKRYDVVEEDFTALVGIYDRGAVDTGDGGYVRRYSTNPTQDADINLASVIVTGKNISAHIHFPYDMSSREVYRQHCFC